MSSGCFFCGKVCDPDRGDEYIITNMDGDYVCSQACKKAREKMDHFCGTVLQDDTMFAHWLGVPVEWVKSNPSEEPEPKEPKRPFNRYTALIDRNNE